MRNEGRHRDYTEQFLAPALSPGDVVVMDNLPAHKVAGVSEAIEAVGASVMYPAALQPRPQPNRDGLRQAEGAPAQSLRPNTRRAMGHHRCPSRSLRPKRMPTLHRPLWLCVRVRRKCSSRLLKKSAVRDRDSLALDVGVIRRCVVRTSGRWTCSAPSGSRNGCRPITRCAASVPCATRRSPPSTNASQRSTRAWAVPRSRRRCCCARPSFRRLIRCAPSAG